MREWLKEYNAAKEETEKKVILWFKRLYVFAGNTYAWFWLIREVFFRQSANFEEYLIWFFLTAGFYWFIIDHRDKLLISN